MANYLDFIYAIPMVLQTGYLPDSVYRELAWYGILQIQPLHHSSKYKVAATLMWQHTLGRPHIIMENPPQSTQSAGKVSRQILAEEAAKWSREQRAAQEVLMENIKSGGNGLTVRTVISARKKSVYIIQNGNYYKCPHGSEPDLDAYRIQANMHERKCTFGKQSIPVAMDPCIEAEVAPIEYSFHEGWMFCLGNELTPAFPTTSENPCESTVCPECLEDDSEKTDTQDKGFALQDEIYESALRENA
ncbi:unnamed protein product [Arctia plantaginis]|uniref:Uncharacterized protein n=1 Tax=Arctia plantaginis TaxID=874455 RepID=A0A8S1AK89_ARCPL|nr:unnamed protein product [Arctia plantaginis]